MDADYADFFRDGIARFFGNRQDAMNVKEAPSFHEVSRVSWFRFHTSAFGVQRF
jgi:hypothetical protein